MLKLSTANINRAKRVFQILVGDKWGAGRGNLEDRRERTEAGGWRAEILTE